MPAELPCAPVVFEFVDCRLQRFAALHKTIFFLPSIKRSGKEKGPDLFDPALHLALSALALRSGQATCDS
jgi:hypothetical protein